MNAEKTLKKMGFSSTDEEGVYELNDVVAIGLGIRVKVSVDCNGVDYAVSLVDVSDNDEDGSETTFARGRAFPKTDEALVNMVSSGIIKQTAALLETVCSRVKAIGDWCGKKGNK